MIGIEEELSVVTQRGQPCFQQSEHQLVRMCRGCTAHFSEQRLVYADLVVFDGIARNANRRLVLLVGDRVTVCRHVLEHTLANPLTESRELPQPTIGVTGRR